MKEVKDNYSLHPWCTEKLPTTLPWAETHPTPYSWKDYVTFLLEIFSITAKKNFKAFPACEFKSIRKIISVRKKKWEISIHRFHTQLESSFSALYSPSLALTFYRSLQQSVNIKQLQHPFSPSHQPGLNHPAYWTAISRSGPCLSLSFFFFSDRSKTQSRFP